MSEPTPRTIVITGASRGLGAGLARAWAGRGHRLGLCARSDPALPEGEAVVAERVDVRDGEAVDAFCAAVAERLGPIDLWVNNAGVLEPILPLRDLTPEQLTDHLAVNVVGLFNGTRAYVRHVREREGAGVLVNVSSGAALKGSAGWTAYCAGKAAVDRITEVAAAEEAEAGLRAYAVAPGVIDTAMQELIRSQPEERFPAVEKFLQLKRDEAFNTPEYVADRIEALAFDPAERPDDVVVRLPPER